MNSPLRDAIRKLDEAHAFLKDARHEAYKAVIENRLDANRASRIRGAVMYSLLQLEQALKSVREL